jgi:ABC-type dipeptide/oligopeptide/nickel transport system permease component
MIKKILRRSLFTVAVLIGVSIISFLLVRLAPGDPALLMVPVDATDAQVDEMRAHMGLDKPYIVQYGVYITNLLHGDLGYSYAYKMPCAQVIFPRLLMTARVTFLGLLVGICISIPMGLRAGIKRGSAFDTFAVAFALMGQACSPVWFCLLLILLFSVVLGWLPAEGAATAKHMIMPVITIAINSSSMMVRMTRSSMIDVLQEDYIAATRARGISKRKVYAKYAFKNAMLPMITILGGSIGRQLGGAMVVETMFNWPGIGTAVMKAISSRDFQLVQSVLFVLAAILVLCNLIVDIVYTFVDKRIEFN